MRLVLASTSPRRAELLRAAGFTFDVLPVDVDERVFAGETPRDYVRRLAAEKSAAAWDVVRLKPDPTGDVVLAADTAVVVDAQILGKPRDDQEAASMLRQLSGRRHEVLTGVSLRSHDGERGFIGATGVYMMELRDEDIAWYVASGEGRDKAGAYAIQGLASRFIPGIDGSYANVVGLPVADVALLLSALASAG
jgi:nucleoside triphosphate pyrophosphatase